MEITQEEKEIAIRLNNFDDEFYLNQSTLGHAKSSGFTSVHMTIPLDRAIELRDKLTTIIDAEVAKINAENSVKVV